MALGRGGPASKNKLTTIGPGEGAKEPGRADASNKSAKHHRQPGRSRRVDGRFVRDQLRGTNRIDRGERLRQDDDMEPRWRDLYAGIGLGVFTSGDSVTT